MANSNDTTKWNELLNSAVSEPGLMLKAYSAFHNYSTGNQLLALVQCASRNIPLGPIASFVSWKDKGRFVKKGEKALCLCMPVTCKRTDEAKDGQETEHVFTRFIYKNNWFALSQTDGAEYVPPAAPGWDKATALTALEITEQPFAMLDGNCQGYAKGREIAINPLAELPIKTTFHEFAHVMLGHTAEGETTDSETTPRSLKEVEAESVALLCLESLGLPGSEYCRGYIQNWGSAQAIPERSAQKIFHAADQILKAGRS